MADRVSSIRDEQIDRNAAWAETFGGNATGSQRRRYADDIAQAEQRHKRRQEEEFQALQLRNPEVGRLVIDREKENRDARNQIIQRDLEERKFRWQTEKDAIAQEIDKKRQGLELRQEQRLMRKAQRDLDDAERMERQTFNVQEGEAELRSQGVLPGSEGYANGLRELLAGNPYIDNGYRQALMRNAFIEQDPAEAQAVLARGGKVTRTQDADGNVKFTFTEAAPKDSNTDDYRERDFAIKERNRIQSTMRGISEEKRNSPEYKQLEAEAAQYDQRARAADSKLRGQGGAPAASNPPAKSNNFTTADDFKSAFQSAPSGTVLMYNGKPYKKP